MINKTLYSLIKDSDTMPTVEHYKFPADDVKRATRFYKDVFDWSMQKWTHPDNSDQDFWYFDTKDEKDKKGMELGLIKRQFRNHTATNYNTVPSVDKYTSKIESAGGKIIIPKIVISLSILRTQWTLMLN